MIGVLPPNGAERGKLACIVNTNVVAGGVIQKEIPSLVVDPLRQVAPRSQYGRLRGFKNTIEAAQYHEREDDFAVFRLFEVTTEYVGYGPRKCA
jgi:hypothetical protein